MKTLLWAVVVLALEVLLLWVYFDVRAVGYPVGTEGALALLVGTVSVVVWLGFKNGFERTLQRLVLAVVGCVILTYVALFADLPTALVCERGRTEVPTPHILGGRFEEYRVGPCVFFNPESRPIGGGVGGD